MPDNRATPGPRLQLVIDVEYTPGSPEAAELKRLLESTVSRFIGSGGLSSDSSAEVENYEVKVIDYDRGAAALAEDEIATWISLQIESGGFSLETLPRQMAVYALANPVDMRNEFAERMHLDDEHRYLFSANWSTVAAESLKTSRWVIDLAASTLIFCELRMEAGGMRQATAVEARTLLMELQPQSSLISTGTHAAGVVESSSDCPGWAQPHMNIELAPDDIPTPRDGAKGRFLVSEGWGHFVGGGPEQLTRWAIDLDAEQLIVAHVKCPTFLFFGKPSEWKFLSQTEARDLAESLVDNDLLDAKAAESFGLQVTDTLPAWAKDHLRVDLVGSAPGNVAAEAAPKG